MKYRFFYLLVISDIITNFILYTPYVLVNQVYEGAFIAIVIAFCITSIKIYFYLYVFNNFKNMTLVQINETLFGKLLGKLLSYSYILVTLGVGFFMYKGLVEIVKNFLLITSPLLLISVILVSIHLIAFRNNDSTFLNSMAYTAVIMALWVCAQVILSYGQVQGDYLKGSIIHSIGIPKFTGIAAAGLFFNGVSHLSLFNPLFKKICYKKTIFIIGLVGFFTALSAVYIPLSIWGPEAARKLSFIWVSTADTMSIDLFIIERTLFLMLPLFFLLALSNSLIYSYTSYSLFRKLHPSTKLDKFTGIIICSAFVAGSLLIPATREVFKYASMWLVMWYVFQFLLSAALYIRTRGKEKSIG
jgi:hypothetical protein